MFSVLKLFRNTQPTDCVRIALIPIELGVAILEDKGPRVVGLVLRSYFLVLSAGRQGNCTLANCRGATPIRMGSSSPALRLPRARGSGGLAASSHLFSVEQLQISSARLGGTGLDWPIGHVCHDRRYGDLARLSARRRGTVHLVD